MLIPNWWLDDITDSMDMSLSKLREMVEDSEAWHAAMGLQKSQTQLSNWTTATINPTPFHFGHHSLFSMSVSLFQLYK